MEIVSITRDKLHLTKISLSNGDEYFIDNDIVAEASLFVGMDITDGELQELVFKSDYRRAKQRALWYLDRMDYTEKGLFDKLIKAGFERHATAEVLAYFCEIGLIDDRRFAERLAERYSQANKSKREILNKLYQKGVPLDIAREVLSETETDEVAQIKALIEKKYAYKLSDKASFDKTFAALARKGFSFSAIKEALKKYYEQIKYIDVE